ncbi:MAG: hypothetical protein JXM70_10885 [Pirellulales bacterium]|nr:hypothetical protein [Pirellulales bacterium]
MRTQQTTSRLRLVFVVGIFFAVSVWIFADVIFHDGMFAFRDAGHFYYPLFQFIQAEWTAGRVPLWNPLENQVESLLGNATSSVFYPGKIIFFLPFGFDWAYRLYVLLHVALAAFWAYRLARHWHGSIEAAGVCGISYAFCGNVLMQHANVIFLVGAAWLPAAMLATDNMLVRRKLRYAVGLGAILALMTLGGDPQMAYNAGLLAVIYAMFFPPQPIFGVEQDRDLKSVQGVARRQDSALHDGENRLIQNRFILITMAAGVGLLLAAVQIFPAMHYSGKSDRATSQTARSLYEIPNVATSKNSPKRIADGLLCRNLDSSTHHGRVYQFSVGPWRLAEYVWPNCSGRQYPINRRWLEAVPAEGRLWVPSLYMGIIPLILAVSAFRLRRGRPSGRWLTWTAILAILASFGWYGLGWLVEEFQLAAGSNATGHTIGQPVGGLYWLMTVVLPGYIYFRYPAKLLVVAAIALSALAARGWDNVFSGKQPAGPGVRRGFAWLSVFSLIAVIISLMVHPFWHDWLAGTEPDVLFGPLDTHGAANDLLFAFLQTTVVCAIAWCLLKYTNQNKHRWTPIAMLVLIAFDLAIANAWMVASAPADLWHAPSKIARAIREDRAKRGQAGPIRVWRHPIWLPAEWQNTSSPDRMAESVRWDRDTLWPKHNLSEGIAVVEVHGTMMSQEYHELLLSAGWPGVMDVTGAEYAILPEDKTLPGGSCIECNVPGASLWRYDEKAKPQTR